MSDAKLDTSLFAEVLEDTKALLRQAAHPKKGTIALSPEAAVLVEGLAASSPPLAANVDEAPEQADAAESGTAPDLGGMGLGELAAAVAGCTKCGLCKSRRQTVFGTGSPEADLVFVGEAPGAEEDRQGEPFVGAAGRLLTDIIVKGMGSSREAVYICNVLKCRPPGNRNPSPDEVFCCEPYLLRQLELIQPKAICALGGVAATTLLKMEASVGSMRGKWHEYHGIALRVTYHPAYLVRIDDPKRLQREKRKVWDDIQAVMRRIEGGSSAAG